MTCSLTGAERLSTAETVEIATPARRATSLIVAMPFPLPTRLQDAYYSKRFVCTTWPAIGLWERAPADLFFVLPETFRRQKISASRALGERKGGFRCSNCHGASFCCRRRRWPPALECEARSRNRIRLAT